MIAFTVGGYSQSIKANTKEFKQFSSAQKRVLRDIHILGTKADGTKRFFYYTMMAVGWKESQLGNAIVVPYDGVNKNLPGAYGIWNILATTAIAKLDKSIVYPYSSKEKYRISLYLSQVVTNTALAYELSYEEFLFWYKVNRGKKRRFSKTIKSYNSGYCGSIAISTKCKKAQRRANFYYKDIINKIKVLQKYYK